MDITKYLVLHEINEKHFEDTKKYGYRYAHRKATGFERKAVEADGYIWNEYQSHMLREVKKLKKIDSDSQIPKDYDDKPERDNHDYYILEKMRSYGKIL